MPYLDYAASNPIDPRVRQAVAQSLDLLGNPSSVHAPGREVRQAVDGARTSVAELLGVKTSEIVFTSGATEANNLALLGYFQRLRQLRGNEAQLQLVVSAIEHTSIRDTLGRLEIEYGVTVSRIPVDSNGVVKVNQLADQLGESTVMVCVMWANNIIGSLQSLKDIAQLVTEVREQRGEGGLPLVLMSDAVQALRTEQVRPGDLGIDMLSLSGHKIYGPKGVGALYLRPGTELAPLITGGGHESGQRAGTENVPGIIGLGQAAKLLAAEREQDRIKIAQLTKELRQALQSTKGLTLLGDETSTVPGIIYALSQPESGDVLALKLDTAGVAVSSGSACDAGTRKTASVLQEINPAAIKHGGIRFSLGRFSTTEDIRSAAAALKTIGV